MNDNRRIRVFVSSTFRDMMGERDELMTHTWPELRRFCRERQVELVEVDLRWGIAEEQSTRKETLKLCLDEIRACRPFFIGLLGERYGWTPGDDAFTADLKEEQPWLKSLHGKSVTELEILHGVLNNPDMAGRAFFYFRDPKFVGSMPTDKKTGFTAEDAKSAEKQTQLKNLIRQTCAAKKIPLHENYPDPVKLAALVLEDLKTAIEAQFPIENIPDALTREVRDHEAFAETRRRTYIGRPDYFEALDRHAASDSTPLILLGDSGIGKSALLANWLAHWHTAHPKDFIFQHYIGGTPDSAEHWRLMTRLIAEIKHWSGDPEELPKSHEDLLKDFPVWLAKARIKAERDGVRCILVLDALNQLEDRDHARLLGWLPTHPFTGALRLVVSTLPGDTLEAVTKHGWKSLHVDPLTPDERHRMIEHYLARFGKKLDAPRLERIAAASAAANPLYLKILLDELRVTGTYDRLDERLADYLAATDIPALLKKVLSRYQHDYERDRKGLVSEVLGLIWAARRGLTETELLRLLKPANLPQLPPAIWNPLRAALEEGLVDRGGILNFAHDFLRTAVETAFVPDEPKRDELRLQLANDFEQQPVSARTCDELPWLLWQARQHDRLRSSLLDLTRFLEISNRDGDELGKYWVWLGEERAMGELYVRSFESWRQNPPQLSNNKIIATGAFQLGGFLLSSDLPAAAEPLLRCALEIDQLVYGEFHANVIRDLRNLAMVLSILNRQNEAIQLRNRSITLGLTTFKDEDPDAAENYSLLGLMLANICAFKDAEDMLRHALEIAETKCGNESPNITSYLNSLAVFLKKTNRFTEAEECYRRAILIEESNFGSNAIQVAWSLNNLAVLLIKKSSFEEAKATAQRTLNIFATNLGPDHRHVGTALTTVAYVHHAMKQVNEAVSFMQRGLCIYKKCFGIGHPHITKTTRDLAVMLEELERQTEAESLLRELVETSSNSLKLKNPVFDKWFSAQRGEDTVDIMAEVVDLQQTNDYVITLTALGELLLRDGKVAEAEIFMRRSVAVLEKAYGLNSPSIVSALKKVVALLLATDRPTEAEPMMRRMVKVCQKFTRDTGKPHPDLKTAILNYAGLLETMGRSQDEILAAIRQLGSEHFHE